MNATNVHHFRREAFYDALASVNIPAYLRRRFDEDAEDNLEAYISSSAENTLIAFKTDIKRWIADCEDRGVDPLAPRARQVRDFVRRFEVGRRPSTIHRIVSNIGVLVAPIMGGQNVCSSKVVRSELKRIRREKGAHHNQALAIRQLGDVASFDDPPRPFSLASMLRVLEPDQSLPALRGKLMLSLGGDTGRRTSEYINADLTHLNAMPDGTGTLHVDRSKTDQDGKGIVRFVSRRTMRYASAWIQARTAAGEAVTTDSPLFIGVDKHGHPGQRISVTGFHTALRSTVRKALHSLSKEHPEIVEEIEDIVRAISGHSFRVGMVQDLVMANEPIASICIEGGWETPDMPLLYGRNLNVRNGGCARLRSRLGDD